MATVFVSNFGAEADGQNDDAEAIMTAINALNPGDTLELMEGTHLVTEQFLGGIAALDFAQLPDNATVQGKGFDSNNDPLTTIKLSDQSRVGGRDPDNNGYVIQMSANTRTFSGIVLRDFAIDGNKQNNPGGAGGPGEGTPFGFSMFPQGDNVHDILIENVSSKNNHLKGFDFFDGGITLRNCDTSQNEAHGFAVQINNGDTDPVVVEDHRTVGNAGLGLDFSNGNGGAGAANGVDITGFYSAENEQGGMKYTTQDGGGNHEVRIEEFRFKDNNNAGLRENITDGTSIDVYLQNGVSEGNLLSGYRLGGSGTHYIGADVKARQNVQDGTANGLGGWYLVESAALADHPDVTTTDLYVHDTANEDGVFNNSSVNNTVDTVFFDNIPGNVVNDFGGTLTVGTQTQQAYSEPPGAPAETDVGTTPNTQSNNAPTATINSFSEVETANNDAEFDVEWSVNDVDGNLASVDVTLTDDTAAATDDTVNVSVSGTNASQTTRVVATGDDGSGNSFTADVTATDGAGATGTASASLTETEPSDPPGGVIQLVGGARRVVDGVVQTQPATVSMTFGMISNVDDTSVDVSVRLDTLLGYYSANVAIEYRETGAGTWNQTATETRVDGQSYAKTISGLTTNTEYEVRGVATGIGEGQLSDTTATRTFTTTAGGVFLIDSFEDYTVGNSIHTEAPEWGTTGAFASAPISDTRSAIGTQATGSTQQTYNQSNSDGSANNQTATFDAYPGTGTTIRCAVYQGGQGGFADIGFGIPPGETNFNNNCYRLRGGPGQAPFLRRTINGNSVSLNSFSNTLSSDTWYDIALEFIEDTQNNNIDLTARIWEWDSGTTSWSEFGSKISATDTNNSFVNGEGVGIAFYKPGVESNHDNLRFFNSLGQNGEPNYTI